MQPHHVRTKDINRVVWTPECELPFSVWKTEISGTGEVYATCRARYRDEAQMTGTLIALWQSGQLHYVGHDGVKKQFHTAEGVVTKP